MSEMPEKYDLNADSNSVNSRLSSQFRLGYRAAISDATKICRNAAHARRNPEFECGTIFDEALELCANQCDLLASDISDLVEC